MRRRMARVSPTRVPRGAVVEQVRDPVNRQGITGKIESPFDLVHAKASIPGPDTGEDLASVRIACGVGRRAGCSEACDEGSDPEDVTRNVQGRPVLPDEVRHVAPSPQTGRVRAVEWGVGVVDVGCVFKSGRSRPAPRERD